MPPPWRTAGKATATTASFTWSSKPTPTASSEKAWVFDEVSHSPFDKIYLSSSRTKFTFDTQRGLVERADSENTQGYGFDGKGTRTTELVAVKDHDEAWTKGFAEEADRYFKAEQTYQDLLTAANHDAKTAEETLAKAEAVLKDARADLKLGPHRVLQDLAGRCGEGSLYRPSPS